MAIVHGSIGTASPEPTGKKLDTATLTTSEGPVHREVTTLGDPTDPEAQAAVKSSAPAASDYGGVVRPIGLVGNLDSPSTWQAVPTVEAALVATTLRVLGIHVVNTTGAPVTFTLKDNAGSPLTILSAFSIPALSILDLPWHGTIFTGGLRWVAGGAGLVGAVEAYQ